MSALRGANLGLRFFLELAAIAAVSVWGFGEHWLLGIAAPSVVIAAWALFVAPKRRFELGRPLRFGVELCVWIGAAAALYASDRHALGVVFGIVAIASAALNAMSSD